MRKRKKKNGISVHAIAGTNNVLLAMDADTPARKGLLGFAIRFEDHKTGIKRWLNGFKFFKSQVPNPQPGAVYSSLEHPIQSFLWGHYSVSPGREYTYTVRPMYGKPGSLKPGKDVTIKIQTEDNKKGKHGVYFNRGAVPSQKFASKFGNRGPEDVNNPNATDVKWLSRGLLEAALDFIGQAKNDKYQLLAAVYEFSYPPIINAFKKAAEKGATIKVIYEAGQKKVRGIMEDTSTTTGNKEAIRATNANNQTNLELIKRVHRRAIPHNKFIILLKNNKPIQVWTGSTNFTPSGFLGQSNVGHIVRDENIAHKFYEYWEQLSKDPEHEFFQDWNTAHSPKPNDNLPDGTTTIFSPRDRSKMLGWYGDRIDEAQQVVMLTAAFGVTRKLAERFNNDKDFLRFLLMERKNRSAETQAMLETDPDTKIAMGAYLSKTALRSGEDGQRLDAWFRREEHYRKRGHIFYIHTKYLLIDVMTDNPLVFTGSANFSPNSLLSNDENMLLIKGDKGVADIYLTEFNRMFNHFYFRYIARMLASAPAQQRRSEKVAHLNPKDNWLNRFFKNDSYHNKRRLLFR